VTAGPQLDTRRAQSGCGSWEGTVSLSPTECLEERCKLVAGPERSNLIFMHDLAIILAFTTVSTSLKYHITTRSFICKILLLP